MQIFSKRTLGRLRETVRRVLDSPPGGQPGPGLSGRPVRQQHPWFRIETNEANGKYTLWRQQWDTATGKLKDWPANRPFTGPLKVYTPEVGYEKNHVTNLVKDMIVRGGYAVQLQTEKNIPATEVIIFEGPAWNTPVIGQITQVDEDTTGTPPQAHEYKAEALDGSGRAITGFLTPENTRAASVRYAPAALNDLCFVWWSFDDPYVNAHILAFTEIPVYLRGY